MSKTHCDISMSLDGFITGPNEGVGNPLGDDDGRLHDWMFAEGTEKDAEVLEEAYARTGAILMGKRMFDVGVEPWGDPPPFHRPVFVLAHHEREPMPMAGGTTYHFVSSGIEAARDPGVSIEFVIGADVMRQYLTAGLLDEIQIHLVPIVLGQGVRLFEDLGAARIEFERMRTIETPAATHLQFRVLK